MKKSIWPLLYVLVSLYGCALTSTPRDRAEKKQWEYAYSGIDTALAIKENTDPKPFIDLVRQYPEIIQYVQLSFSYERLSEVAIKINDLTAAKNALNRFCIVAPVDQCTQANNNLVEAEKLIKKELRLGRDLYASLNLNEQKLLKNNYKLIFYELNEIGTITDRQVQNISTPGSNAGAEIGGAVGATAYISNATPSSYSMKSDLTSTVLGALAGAALMNKSPTEQYVIRYSLKLRNGEIRQVDQVSSTPLGQSIGMCVSMPGAILIDQSLCTMTLAEFRVKYAGEIKE